MTTEAAPLAPDVVAPPARPGYCNVHPNQRLVTHAQVGLSWYYAPVSTVCAFPEADHPDNQRERCRWCGGPLHDGTRPRWQVSDRREFCTPNHRLRAFRARAREETKR